MSVSKIGGALYLLYLEPKMSILTLFGIVKQWLFHNTYNNHKNTGQGAEDKRKIKTC